MIYFKKGLMAFIWAIPFLLSGIAAPVLFSKISNRQIAGHYAGALFLFSGIWLVLLSIRHHYSPIIQGYVITFFALSLYFWSWRFRNNGPLDGTFLAGLRGDMWHHALTGMYLVSFGILVILEFRRAN